MTAPLNHIKVLDFSTLLPGPYATMLLADLGAEVVRVEPPTRPDMVRHKPPLDGGSSAWHGFLNRSKRSLALDLKEPSAAAVVKRLVQRYDVVLEQFRPGVMDRLGVGYEALSAANPRLIYCAITGYGQDGPYRDRAGHDINYLALAGISAQLGRDASGPVPLPVQLADVGAGSFGAIMGLLAAIIHREQSGEGQFVDVSMFDGALFWNGLAIADFLASGREPQREQELLNGGTYYDYYRTRDGGFLAVGSLEPKFWRTFCEALGRPELAGEKPEPGVQQGLKDKIQEEIAKQTREEWVAHFSGLDICVEPVLSVAEAVAHSQTKARKMIVAIPRPGQAPQKQVAHPVRFSRSQPSYRHTGAPLGEHTEEILREAGYDQGQIEAMRAAGVLG